MIGVKVTGFDNDHPHKVLENSVHRKPRIGHGGSPGLVVYQERLIDFVPAARPFLNPEQGVAMNVDAAFGGTPDGVHNGIDSVLWTGTSISGTSITFNSTDRAYAGTNSVKCDSPSVNNVWQFDKGSTVAADAYVAFTGYINVDTNWTIGDSIQVYMYDTVGGLQVGNRVNLEDYINETNFDIWQKFVMSFDDLGATGLTYDSVRFEVISKSGPAPTFYLDNMQLEQTGEPIEYIASASGDTPFHVSRARFSIADALAGTVASGTMAGLSYDKILGIASLGNGIVIKRVRAGVTEFSSSFHQLSDFLSSRGTVINSMSDGTNTFILIEMVFDYPIILQPNTSSDYVSLTLSDDLSGLLLFTAALFGGTEV